MLLASSASIDRAISWTTNGKADINLLIAQFIVAAYWGENEMRGGSVVPGELFAINKCFFVMRSSMV